MSGGGAAEAGEEDAGVPELGRAARLGYRPPAPPRLSLAQRVLPTRLTRAAPAAVLGTSAAV